METAVLPAQDHLAQERYRHQSRVMSGMMFPLEGLPRMRRKVKSYPQVFAAASVHSETARVSSNQIVHTADARSGVASPMDVTLGVLRNSHFSASTPSHPPMSVLKAPQYRLHNAPNGFISHESSSPPKKQQQQAAVPFATPVLSGASAPTRLVLRTRSDGELLRALKKGAEVEKTSDRRKPHEKGAENTKGLVERILTEKLSEKAPEKSFDRRKGLERRTVDKKSAPINSSHGDKSSTVQKKPAVITILQRPLTKEAAAENMAKFTGRSIEVVTMQMQRSIEVISKPQEQVEMLRGDVAVIKETLRDLEAIAKDGESDRVHPGNANTVSPKRLGKKKPSRDSSVKFGSRSSENVLVDVGSTKELERRVHHSQSLHVLGDRESRRSEERNREASPVSVPSMDGIVSDLTNQGFRGASPVASSGVLHRGLSGSFEGGHILADSRNDGASRSGSFREVSRAGDSGAELIFLPSSPPKNSERWAGPAYTNSPPPSTLPFPTFPIQRVKSSLTEVTLPDVVLRESEDEKSFTKASSAPSSPTHVASVFFSASALQSPFVDPSSATKDLRRMLNLDVEEGVEDVMESIWKRKDILRDSATQGLKRILQLS